MSVNNEEENRKQRIKQQKEVLIKRLLICLSILLVITVIFIYVNKSAAGTEIDVQTYQEQLVAGNIQQINLNQSKIQIYYKNGDIYEKT